MKEIIILVGLVVFIAILFYPTSPELQKKQDEAIRKYRKRRAMERLESTKINLDEGRKK